MRELMGIEGIVLGEGVPGGIQLAEAFRLLDEQRLDLDRRMATLAPDDPARDDSWQALETVLAELREVVINLAKSPAVDLLELRAKAGVLATLLRSEVDGGGQIFTDAERAALALSITDDIARL
jgi:hypothetical protein